MDLRLIPTEQRLSPYKMAINYLKNNEKEYLKKLAFLEKTTSIEEVENLLLLCEHAEKDSDFIVSVLNSFNLRELKNESSIIKKGLNELFELIESDPQNIEYYKQEIFGKTSSLSNKEIEQTQKIEKTLEMLEIENQKLNKELLNSSSSNMFMDTIDKKKNTVKAMSVILLNREIKNIKQLSTNSLFIDTILKNDDFEKLSMFFAKNNDVLVQKSKEHKLKNKTLRSNKPKLKNTNIKN